VSTCATVPFIHWLHNVMVAAKVSWDELVAVDGIRRMHIWFDAGETIEGAAEMLRVFVDGAEKAKRMVRPLTMRDLTAVGCVFTEKEID